ncbi:hypothetical protein [Spirosoma sp.]|uniref:hypothetical protein n=1 Tax=Spirosoma sp. TaxID=1899569 RepID=UPI002629776B|nr:hypothetical protein [Spirosoma sp.]MCX6213816.1 hypothetical protein [Spirosoma sp.]
MEAQTCLRGPLPVAQNLEFEAMLAPAANELLYVTPLNIKRLTMSQFMLSVVFIPANGISVQAGPIAYNDYHF